MKKIILVSVLFIFLLGCLTEKTKVTEQQSTINREGIAKNGVTKAEAESLAKDEMLISWNTLFPIVETVKTDDGSWKVIYEHNEGNRYFIIDSETGEIKGYT